MLLTTTAAASAPRSVVSAWANESNHVLLLDVEWGVGRLARDACGWYAGNLMKISFGVGHLFIASQEELKENFYELAPRDTKSAPSGGPKFEARLIAISMFGK